MKKTVFFSTHSLLPVLLAGVLVSGCQNLPGQAYYQLQASLPEAPLSEADTPVTVLLGPLKLGDYLQREAILQRQADGRLLESEGRWAGAMEDEAGQLLLRQLARQLGSSQIALYPDRIGVQADYQIVLAVSRLDSGAQVPARLEGHWRLLDGRGAVLNSGLLDMQAEHAGDLSSQVAEQGRLLEQLAGLLATAIRQQPSGNSSAD